MTGCRPVEQSKHVGGVRTRIIGLICWYLDISTLSSMLAVSGTVQPRHE